MNASRFLVTLPVILCLVLAPVLALVPTDTAQAQPADSDWPMFRQDPQRTGRSPYGPPAFTFPELKWSFDTGYEVWSSPAIGADGTIYVGSRDGELCAINPDGTEKWAFLITWYAGSSIDITSSPAIGADGTIYVGSWDGNLYAINPDGSQSWNFTTGDRIYSSPAIGADGTIYVGSHDGEFYAINPNGTKKWSFYVGVALAKSPAIGADGTIYIGDTARLWALNPANGIPKWEFSTEYLALSSTPAIGADGTIYVGCMDGCLYAINPADGSQKWRFPTGGEVRSSPAIGADGTIYFGSNDGHLHAISDLGNYWDLKWHFYTWSDRVESSPAIGADGTIYVGAQDGKLHAINPDGTELWSFPTGDRIDSSPAIGADGTIYVGSWDGNLYAITGYEYTLTITVGDPPSFTAPSTPSPRMGSVLAPGEGTFTYRKGEEVPLGAVAEEGYHFVEWTGDVSTMADVNSRITTITMNDNYTIRANFAEGEEQPLSGGCFIATAAYGTPMADEIHILREFRDEYLLTNPVGQDLVDLYYRVSPPMAEFITGHPVLKPVVRAGLLPAVAISAVTVNTTPAEKIAMVGLVALISVALAAWAKKRRVRSREYH